MDELINADDFEAANANARGRRAMARGPRAISARYDAGAGRRIVVELDNGCAFAFPVDQAQGLVGAREADLNVIEISPSGLGLHWPALDADLSVPALVRGVLGTKQWMAQIGQAGGQATTDKKAAASRANGKRGGRPPGARKAPQSA